MASPETFLATEHGQIYSQDAVYLTARNAATGDVISTTNDYLNTANNRSAPNYRIYRSFINFDTSALPDDCTITIATLSMYGSGAGAEYNAGHSDLKLYEGTHADTPTTADFDSFNEVLLSDDLSPWEFQIASDAYTAVTLNAAGRGIISKTGLTKFCLRVKGDVDASVPGGSNNHAPWSEDKGAGYQPKLVVTYTVAEVEGAYGVVV